MTGDQLLREALLNHPNDLTNLTSQSWWSSQPLAVRQDAYAKLQSTLSSPQALANFVKANNIQNVQNYSWWSTSPHKQQAWNLISPPTQTTQTTPTTRAPGSVAPAQQNRESDPRAAVNKVIPQTTDNTSAAASFSVNGPNPWGFVGGSTDGQGRYVVKPKLTINGKVYQFETPQEYINKINEITIDPSQKKYFDAISQSLNNQVNEWSRATQKTISPVGEPTTLVSSTNTSGSASAPTTPVAPIKPTKSTAEYEKMAQAALDYIDASNLDEHTKDLYKTAVANWDPRLEINIPNIIKAFDKIKTETLDPYYRDLIKQTTDQFQTSYNYLNQQRALEKEQEKVIAQENISNAKLNLEASGMSRTGEGVKQLGAQSVYAQPGQNNVIPTQTAGFGGIYAEGLVPQSNRLMATSSSTRYQNNQQNLARSAESLLGTTGLQQSGLNFGVPQLGGVIGSIPGEQQQSNMSAATGLYNQESINAAAKKNYDAFV